MMKARARGAGPESGKFRSRSFVVGLVVALGVVLPVAPAHAEPGVRRVGSLDRHTNGLAIGATGNILIDASDRRAYQALEESDPNIHTTIRIYDLDRLREVGRIALPPLQPAQTDSGPVEWLWTLDETRHHLFALAASSDPQTGAEKYPLLDVDLHARSYTTHDLWTAGTRLPLAMSYYAPSDRLYFFTRAPVEVLGRSAFFVEERRRDGGATWPEYRLGNCYGARDHQYPATVARSVLQPSRLYLNCYNSGTVQALVVRLHLGSAGPDAEEVFPAVPGPLSTMFDAGSDRMVFLTTNGGAGRGAWVFDGLRSTFLGVIASGDARAGASAYALGLDPRSGRLYMQTAVGLLVADARRTPLPAGLLFRSFAAPGLGSIPVDPMTHRLFVPDGDHTNDVGQPTRYLVLEDDVAASVDPPPGNPDSLTAGIPERDGVTNATYSGAATAYGVRALTTGGVQKAVWNVALGQFPPDDNGPNPAWTALQTAPLDAGNRDVRFAHVRGVTLSNDAADASAIAGEADNGTGKDVERAGGSWPFEAAECHDTAGAQRSASSPGGTAGASCDGRARDVMASAGVPRLEGQGISVGAVQAWSSASRETARGMVARSVAVVHELAIGNTVWVGELRTDAEAWAHGRAGTAGARFTRRFADVRIDANGDGKPEFSCSACDASAVATALGRALAGVATVDLPSPDDAYYPNGSRGGYQAIVQKERFRGFAERALNDDESVEVPGLQLVYYSDARAGRTRQVLQFAGVEAESHYGISLLPGSTPPVVDPPAPIVDQVPVVVLKRAEPPTRPLGVARPAVPRRSIERVLERIATGVGMFVSSPAQAAKLLVLWAFLALPAYLIVRRRVIRA